MATFLQLLAYGIALGAMYALVAVSLLAIYKASNTLSFAHIALITLGAYTGYILGPLLGVPYLVVLPMSLVIGGAIGWAVELVFMRYFYTIGADLFTKVVATIAIFPVITGLVRAIAGSTQRASPSPFIDRRVRIGSVVLNVHQLLTILVSVLILIAMTWLFSRWKWGLAMRAVSQSQVGAMMVGISLTRAISLSWILSGAVMGLVGTLYAPLTVVSPDLGGVPLLIIGFASAVVAGFSRLVTAASAAVLLGILEGAGNFYLPSIAPIFPFTVIICVVLIFGEKGLRLPHSANLPMRRGQIRRAQ